MTGFLLLTDRRRRLSRVGTRLSLSLPRGMFYGAKEASVLAHGFHVHLMAADIPPEEMPTHRHQEASFVCILSGIYISGAIGAGRCVSPLLIYNPPGTTHRDRFETLERSRFLAISLPQEVLDRISCESVLMKRATVVDSGKALATALTLAGLCAATEADEVSVQDLCIDLLTYIGRIRQPRETRPPLWLRQARETLWEECTLDLSLADLAESAGVHPVHFSRAFRQFFRMTPGAFVRRARVLRGAKLLTQTRIPISEIAFECGFSDQSHFTKAFSRELQIPPASYRKSTAAKSVPMHNSYKTGSRS